MGAPGLDFETWENIQSRNKITRSKTWRSGLPASTATEFVFNAAGQRVSEWNGTTRAQLKGKYYWGAMPVAYYAGGTAHFEHQDWLGTERMRTAYNGAVEQTLTSLPFGDAQTTDNADAYHYAGLDHDTETNSDHAQFRQYSSTQGRWLSPDPYGGSYDFSNPQSMNRYAYVGSSPLANIDPTGLVTIPNSYEFISWGDAGGGCYDPVFMDTTNGDLAQVTGTTVCPVDTSGVSFIGSGGFGGQLPPFPLITGGGDSAPNNGSKRGLFTCASEAGAQVSLANALHMIPGLKSGAGGFVADAVGGNAFSGATDLTQSIATGEGGGHSVFYNMAQGVVAGPTQGFGSAFGKAIEGTPWASGPMDAAMGATLGEYASGVGELKLAYDAGSYAMGLFQCATGIIH